jgi:hypothetical protein
MLRLSKFDRRSKNKVSKRINNNISTHPFVIASIVAALAMVVWTLAFFIFRF